MKKTILAVMAVVLLGACTVASTTSPTTAQTKPACGGDKPATPPGC